MEYEKAGDQLTIRLARDFNLFTARRVGALAEDAAVVRIDLSGARIVDSEAVRLLYTLTRAGKRVTLMHPPAILTEVIDILGLGSVLDVAAMTEAPHPGETHDH